MNLAKHDAETEMELNMTSMIDVVFLLIIFFMIITDLTQQDLEDLKLPLATAATEDKPDPTKKRPIFNVKHNGEIVVSREVLYSPEVNDSQANPLKEVESSLVVIARGMPKGETDGLPDDPLMIRGDEVVPSSTSRR
ncbi:MAG: biopolymer transporter ExbD [Planctomycetota bacterium]